MDKARDIVRQNYVLEIRNIEIALSDIELCTTLQVALTEKLKKMKRTLELYDKEMEY